MQNQLRSHNEADAVDPGAGNGRVRSLLHAAGIGAVTGGSPAVDAATVRQPGQPLPLVGLFDTGTDRSRYWTVTTVNERGRIADRTPLKAVGWDAGTPVTIAMIPPAGVIVVRRGGTGVVTRQGHLRVPADVRHGCRIRGGDRLLVVAHPAEDLLVAYTPYAIDAMAASYHTSIPVHA